MSLSDLVDVKVLLDSVFSFERKADPKYQDLIDRNDFMNECCSVPVSDENIGLKGTIPMIYPGRNNTKTLAVYTAEPFLGKEGNFLQDPFNEIKDCPYIYYGLMVSCLALISKKKFDYGMAVMIATGESVNLRINTVFAERFILQYVERAWQLEKQKAETAGEPVSVSGKKQFALFM